MLGELPWNIRSDDSTVLEFEFCKVDLAPLCAQWDSGLDERSNGAILCGEIQHILMTEHELLIHWSPATSPRLPRVNSGAGAFLGDPDVWIVTYRARVGRAWESRLETYSSEAGADAVCDRLTRDPRTYRDVAKKATRLRH